MSAAGTRPHGGDTAAAPGMGTVVVTGASEFVGRQLLAALAASGAWTVALTRRHCGLPAGRELSVALTAKAAREVLDDADQIVHLAAGLPAANGSYWDANVDTALAVAGAAHRGRARRVVFLSALGADLAAANAYLRTNATVERVLARAARELVALRTGPIVGPPDDPGPLFEALARRPDGSVLVPGDGTQRLAPVSVDDVVAALMAALRGGPAGTFDLAGPGEMTLDQLVALVSRPPVHIRHVPAHGAGRAADFLPSGPPVDVDGLRRRWLAAPARAEEAFGLTTHPLRRVWN